MRLALVDGTAASEGAVSSPSGAFEVTGVAAGWYVLAAWRPGFHELVKAIHAEGDVDVGAMNLGVPPRTASRPPQADIPALTVCEALDRRESLVFRPIVIVGVFKSGMDETLRLDCPEQLVSGAVGWPSAIGLTNPLPPPEALRAEIEKKRQEVLKSSPPEAPLRPERVVGLYGYFASVAGLTAAPCCKAPVETVLPPARLFSIGATDLRVIR